MMSPRLFIQIGKCSQIKEVVSFYTESPDELPDGEPISVMLQIATPPGTCTEYWASWTVRIGTRDDWLTNRRKEWEQYGGEEAWKREWNQELCICEHI